jgi:hypothetical protein
VYFLVRKEMIGRMPVPPMRGRDFMVGQGVDLWFVMPDYQEE